MATNTIFRYRSSSSSHTTRTYPVFVSFRGEDTRNNFTDFLFQALRKNDIYAFKDDADLKKGESIKPQLLQAIEGSQLFVVIFSKSYASSTWCLRELAHICNCIETWPRPVLPIFYDIDPSEVRKQSGYYEKAFAEYEECFREDKEKIREVEIWRKALTQVANFCGWDLRNKPQSAEIEEIVQHIKDILTSKFSTLSKDHLVGMESRVDDLAQSLNSGLKDEVRVVGIWGMGGIGKTTLAHALYERISHQYDFHCFIDNVKELLKDFGTLGVEKELLNQTLNVENLDICNVSHLRWSTLRNKRVLIILDDVDEVEQLKMFTRDGETPIHEWLGGGSKVIIISRNKRILTAHGVDVIHQVQLLNKEDSAQLFIRNAFKDNFPMRGYEELTDVILSHAHGVPLAIKVLGSFLFGQDVSKWRRVLARLKESTVPREIMDLLRISFDGLVDIEKQIFLDIACFLNNHSKQYVTDILDIRGFQSEYGLGVLVNKSFISILEHEVIHMHDLLIDLGRNVVQEKALKEPRMWSRLWDYQNFHKVMSDNMVADNLEVIFMEHQNYISSVTVKVDALSKMNHLKVLKLVDVNFKGSLNYLSSELGYLHWNKFPFECLPPSFQPDKLIELRLHNSNFKYLWKGEKSLHNLKRLDLSHSVNLIKMPDFGDAKNLEMLNLEGCIQLEHMDPYIGFSRKLLSVNLKNCVSLIKLPHFRDAQNLEILNLEGCKTLGQIDPSVGFLRNLTVLNLKDCKNLISLPNNILALDSLEYVSLSGCSKLYNIQSSHELWHGENLKNLCKRLIMLPLHLWDPREHKDSLSCLLPSMPTFPCVRQLDLSFCYLVQIPDAIGNLRCLESLNLSRNSFATLPNLKELSKLYHLDLQHCKQLRKMPELPSRTNLPSQIYMPPLSIATSLDDEKAAGVYILNCPEFEREYCTTKTISWMIQIVQADHHCKCLTCPPLVPRIESIIPGSEILSWFNNQNVGDLITIDASSLMHDNSWIGIACCAVFVVHHGRRTVLATGPPETGRAFTVNVPVVLNADLVTDESDHLWLFYITRSQFIEACKHRDRPHLDDLKLEFDVRDKHGLHFEVRKYGFRWVSEQDLYLF